MYYKWVVVVIVVVVVVVVVVVDGGGDVDLEVSKVMVLPPNHPKCLVIFFTPGEFLVTVKEMAKLVNRTTTTRVYYSYGPLPVISTYNPIYRMYNPIYNQL